MNKRALTSAEAKVSSRLRDLWLAHKDAHRTSQRELAKHLGWSQSAVAQFINGTMPLSTDAKFKFAKFFDIPVTDLDPLMMPLLEPGRIDLVQNGDSVDVYLTPHERKLAGDISREELVDALPDLLKGMDRKARLRLAHMILDTFELE